MPYCCEEEVLCGTLGIKRPAGDNAKVQKMFFRLMDWKLSLWNDVSHKEAARRPVVDIPVNRDTSILEKGLAYAKKEIVVVNLNYRFHRKLFAFRRK